MPRWARNTLITDDAEKKLLLGDEGYKKQLQGVTEFIPVWVKIAVALALGLGTMIGWKRIVVTVGEKIGKTHLTYAQGGSAELVAMGTILLADHYNLPVSTTHVLSSGVAGTMAANNSGLQTATLRNLLMAWVLTLPVCVILGAGTFSAGLMIIYYNLTMIVPSADCSDHGRAALLEVHAQPGIETGGGGMSSNETRKTAIWSDGVHRDLMDGFDEELELELEDHVPSGAEQSDAE